MLLLTFATLLSLASLSTLTPTQLQQPLSSTSSNPSSPFSFNLDLSSHPHYLTSLPDNTSLASLSIPGTHDSLTHLLTSPTSRCQNHLLLTQLQAGIRYLDIRPRIVNNTLLIYHEEAYTSYTYSSVLLTIFSFLSQNPGEAILMRLKEESTPLNSSVDFETLFNHYRLLDPDTSPGCRKHFYLPPSLHQTTIPTLGSLRGKIVILQNFGALTEPAQYGIKWEDPLLVIEDEWEVDDLYSGLNAKWEAVRESLEDAREEDGRLYLTHLSASVGVLPVEAATGKEESGVVGMNERIGRWLRGDPGEGVINRSLGVVIADFPGKELVEEVLRRN